MKSFWAGFFAPGAVLILIWALTPLFVQSFVPSHPSWYTVRQQMELPVEDGGYEVVIEGVIFTGCKGVCMSDLCEVDLENLDPLWVWACCSNHARLVE